MQCKELFSYLDPAISKLTITGYNRQVDWNDSTVLDLYMFGTLLTTEHMSWEETFVNTQCWMDKISQKSGLICQIIERENNSDDNAHNHNNNNNNSNNNTEVFSSPAIVIIIIIIIILKYISHYGK